MMRFAPALIRVFNETPEVIRMGSNFLRITGLGTVFIAPGLVLGRSMSGAGDTTSPLVITFITLWVIQIPLAFILSRLTPLGLNGVWLAVLIAYFSQATMAISWFLVGRWKLKRV